MVIKVLEAFHERTKLLLITLIFLTAHYIKRLLDYINQFRLET